HREYRERILELRAELAEAEGRGDLHGSSRASAELEALLQEIAGAGRGRRVASHAERARQTGTKGIGGALDKMRPNHPEPGRHLATTIKRGYFCSYNPDERAPASWQR